MAGALAALVVAVLWAQTGPALQSEPRTGNGTPPLTFVPNAGQTDEAVQFTAQGGGFAFGFTPDKAMLSLTKGTRGMALHLKPLGASPDVRLVPGDLQPGKVNYLSGAQRHTNLPTYATLTYRDLWPGIDMVFRGTGGALKYEFHVRPGADPSRIRLAYRGADSLAIGSAGNLLIGTPLGTLRDSRPRSWQLAGGKRVAVGSRYALHGGTGYGFALGPSHDSRRALVIDPGLTYSTFLGGTINDQGNAIAIDGSGNAYVAGQADSSNFPTTAGAFDTTFSAQTEVFVTKLNPTGTAMVYSTYLGGAGDDIGRGIAVDSFGSAYVTGSGQTGFPTTAGAFDTSATNIDAFVTKLNSSGSALLYSTFLGGGNSDNGNAIAVDSTGMAYVGGDTLSSTNFPTTAGAFDTTGNGGGSNFDGFVAKLNSAGSALVYSTYLGGAAGQDTVSSIALDSGTAATVSGQTGSNNFPTTAGSFDTSFNGGPNDAFVSELNPTGTALNYSTFLGGMGEELQADVALDSAGNAYFGGGTTSGNYPTTPGAFDPLDNPSNEVVVTKLNSTGTAMEYSTFIGSGGSDLAHDIAVDTAGNAYITGSTTSSSYPVSTGAFDESHNGGADVIVSRLNAAGSALTHSTFLGSSATEVGRGIAVDGALAYITGDTAGAFPTTAGAADTTHNGAADAFVAKLNMTPTAAPGYVRPLSASPFRLSLVPTFVACTSPDRVHGPPDLPGGTNPDGSCNPPVHQSTFVTVGAPDANGKPVNSVGSLRLKTIPGNVGTATDEADLLVEATITDVRNTSGLTDYTGQLRVELDLRITDRFNGATNTETGTQANVKFFVPLTCLPTGGAPDIGSVCSANTTADAITPSVVREGIRSVWEVGQVVVHDGGADGDTSTTPNGFFARQGVLIP